MPLFVSEDKAITKLLKPLLKERYFVKTSVRLDRIHLKLKNEGCLSSEEINVKHPFHPDIDVLYWLKEYTGEPVIKASEVKYFRLRDGLVYPNIYEGIGEATMLLSFGFDNVSLWHLFDPEIPSETVSRYRDLTQSLISDTNSPINYQSWLLPELPPESSKEKLTSEDISEKLEGLLESFQKITFTYSIAQTPKPNSLRNRWDAKIVRSIIKKNFRIINKS